MLKNPSYSGITTEFWNSCDAICSKDYWTLWGTPNCGKGQPMQTMGTGMGLRRRDFARKYWGQRSEGNERDGEMRASEKAGCVRKSNCAILRKR